MKTAAFAVLLISCGVTGVIAQVGPRTSFIRQSPILNLVDTDQNGVLSPPEIAAAPSSLRKLDTNSDGKLSRDEAGLRMGRGGRGGRGDGGEGRGGRGGRGGGEATAPSAEELTMTFMMFDANQNGKLEKNEVPERIQGLFTRGDTNHDNVLTHDEIAQLAGANRQQADSGEGRGRGPGGNPTQFDLAFNVLDKNRDGEISPEEINSAATSLKTLDKNNDGQITAEEVTPADGPFGPRR